MHRQCNIAEQVRHYLTHCLRSLVIASLVYRFQ